MYTAFSDVYDQLMQEVDYEKWADYLFSLLQEKGIQKGNRCAECACGTGNLTLPLGKKGLQMTGLDLSEEMLSKAMVKARKEGLLIPFIRQDMRFLALPKRVHALLSTCDGVNYLLEEKDLLSFFSAAYTALRPGGVLLFDVSTPDKLKNTLGNNTLTRAEKDFAYIWENTFEDSKVHMNLTIFARHEGEETFSRFEESQIQRAWTHQELKNCLLRCGFKDIAFFGRMRTTPPRTGDERWHVLSVKPRL